MSRVSRSSVVRRRPAAVVSCAAAARGLSGSSVSSVTNKPLVAAVTSLSFPTKLDKAATGSDFQQKWFELQKLLERQRAKGGVIDPEVESNRFLIHINEVRTSHIS